MARLNVDYRRLRCDYRFKALIKRVGEGDAWERLLRFWDSAQEFWGKEKALVPAKAFDLEGDLEVLIEVDLAERREAGIYARGAEEHFDWYLQKCRASRAGVAAKKSKKEPIGKPIGEPSLVDLKVNPPTPALTLTLKDTDRTRPAVAGPAVVLLLETWNTHRGPLDAVRDLGPPKIRQAEARLWEHPNIEFWVGVIKRLAASPFATGKIPTQRRPKGWRASFFWLIANTDNALKVAAGEYDDAAAPKKPLKLLTAEDLHT